jgi:hypothetical protein
MMLRSFVRATVLTILLLCTGLVPRSFSQECLVSGTIRDGSTTEILPFANISLMGQNIGTVSDADGAYRLRLKRGVYKLLISFVG